MIFDTLYIYFICCNIVAKLYTPALSRNAAHLATAREAVGGSCPREAGGKETVPSGTVSC